MEYTLNAADDTPEKKINDKTGLTDAGINLQVGLYADKNSVINLNIKCFSNASVSGLFNGLKSKTSVEGSNVSLETIYKAAGGEKTAGGDVYTFNSAEGMNAFAAACAVCLQQSYPCCPVQALAIPEFTTTA